MAIVPGNVDASELVRRILSIDSDLKMPPASSGKTLTAQQIELLKQWIAEGAEYQGYWAFLSVARPDLPAVKNEA